MFLGNKLYTCLLESSIGIVPSRAVYMGWRMEWKEGGSHTIMTFGLRFGLRTLLEFGREGDIVEECPRVVELAIPCSFQVTHRGEHALQFLIPHQRQKCSIDPGRIWVVGGIGVSLCPPKWLSRFSGS